MFASQSHAYNESNNFYSDLKWWLYECHIIWYDMYEYDMI